MIDDMHHISNVRPRDGKVYNAADRLAVTGEKIAAHCQRSGVLMNLNRGPGDTIIRQANTGNKISCVLLLRWHITTTIICDLKAKKVSKMTKVIHAKMSLQVFVG